MTKSASSPRDARAKVSEPGTAENGIVAFIGDLDDGTYVVEHADGRLERLKDETDWTKFDAMTDEDIERAVADDPDWDGFRDIDWSKVEVVRNEVKTPISIRLDSDVLDFFKKDGAGYQKRINAVLRSFVRQRKRSAVFKAAAKKTKAAKKA